MDFVAQDSSKLLILMIAGAAFAVAGLWLLLRPKPSGSTAKIELFGLKFESSSAGLLVFLIGAAFLVIPLFVPEKDVRAGVLPGPGAGEAPGLQVGDLQANTAIVLPNVPGAEEIEPNERVQSANQLAIGTTVAGKMRRGDTDWYAIPTQSQMGQKLVVTLRHVSGGGVYAELFDRNEERRAQMHTTTGADVGMTEIMGPIAYVKVQPNTMNKASQYELTSRVEDP